MVYMYLMYFNVYWTLKTYHHVNFMFTQKAPLNNKSLNVGGSNSEMLNIEWGKIDPKYNNNVNLMLLQEVLSSIQSSITPNERSAK